MYSLLYFSPNYSGGGKWTTLNCGHQTMIEAMQNMNNQSGQNYWETSIIDANTSEFVSGGERYRIVWHDNALRFDVKGTGKSVIEVFREGRQVGNIITGSFYGYSDTHFSGEELIEIACECIKMKEKV